MYTICLTMDFAISIMAFTEGKIGEGLGWLVAGLLSIQCLLNEYQQEN